MSQCIKFVVVVVVVVVMVIVVVVVDDDDGVDIVEPRNFPLESLIKGV